MNTATLSAKRTETARQSAYEVASDARNELFYAQNLIKVMANALTNLDEDVPDSLCINTEKTRNSRNYDLIMVLQLVNERIETSLNYLDQPEVFNRKEYNL